LPIWPEEDQPTVETKLEQIAVKAVNQLPKSVVRENRAPRSVGAGRATVSVATVTKLAPVLPLMTETDAQLQGLLPQ
jgi:hypothetical protein